MTENEEMDRFIEYLIQNTRRTIVECKRAFLEKYPGRDSYFDRVSGEWLDA